MPRRAIIAVLVVLILGILGGTGVLIYQRLRSDTSSTPPTSSDADLPDAATGGQRIVDDTGDDDGDGLNNADERLWGTDPKVADTDNDSYLDGQEVAANHNPTIAAPNDTLPAGFKPGQNLQPLDNAPAAPIAVDQFFVSDLDLTGGDRNITEVYNQQYSTDERSAETLTAFVLGQTIVTNLPTPASKALQVTGTDSPVAIREYLAIAGNSEIFASQTLLTASLKDLYEERDPASMQGMAYMIRLHQKNLIELKVPPTAASFHKLLLGYTELLAATFDQIAVYPTDPVKSAVGIRQLEEIDKRYYPLIQQEIVRLENESS